MAIVQVEVELTFECPNYFCRARKIIDLPAIPMPGDGLDLGIDEEEEEQTIMFLVEGRIFTIGCPPLVHCDSVALSSERIPECLKEAGWSVAEIEERQDNPDTLTQIHVGVDDANNGISELLKGEHLSGLEARFDELESLCQSIHELVEQKK